MLTVADVRAGYAAADVLEGISLEVPDGACVAVIGANGAGKTTLLWALSGLLPLRAGTVVFGGTPLHAASAKDRLAAGVVHCPEGRRVFAHMSVADNLRVGAHTVAGAAVVAERLEEAYARFPRLRERRRQMAGTLSGGEQQMLALARALMSRPALLMLDEPSLGLAPKAADEVFATIAALQADGMSVLLVEQNAAMALRLSSYGYVLEHGRIALSGPSHTLAGDPRVQRAYLGGG